VLDKKSVDARSPYEAQMPSWNSLDTSASVLQSSEQLQSEKAIKECHPPTPMKPQHAQGYVLYYKISVL
jgi:hypothetical protein